MGTLGRVEISGFAARPTNSRMQGSAARFTGRWLANGPARWTEHPLAATLKPVEVMMLPVASRLGILLLLICDYWGDPGLALSPLARPLCSTPANCTSFLLRGQVEHVIANPPQTPAGVPAISTTTGRGSTEPGPGSVSQTALPASPPLPRLQP